MHVVLVSGDRGWTDIAMMRSVLEELQERHGLDLLVVHGDARGADTIAHELCESLGIDEARFPANWKGRMRVIDGRNVYYAGPYRNQLMLDVTEPNEVICFHDRIQWSKGTKDMRDRALKAGLPVRVVSHQV